MTNIILCGGNGTRLWPISRTLMPKQFVKLLNDTEQLLIIIEAQVGSYTGEDDIVRLDNDFKRMEL